MSVKQDLLDRSGNTCELCATADSLSFYNLPPAFTESMDESIVVCPKCKEQIEDPETMDGNHWRCLNDSMWSTVPAVQAMAWRMLQRLKNEDWSGDLLDMLYLDEQTLKFAQADGDGADDDSPKHKDCNGTILKSGDSVTLIKNLDVKGTSMTAKRGTSVKRITLVDDNHEHIEGKVEGQNIVILTKFVKKTS